MVRLPQSELDRRAKGDREHMLREGKAPRLSKNNQVYGLIINRLVHARYAFGERILVKELIAETGASRQPIMSALNRLSADGFVQIIPQVGCQVIDPSRDEIADFFLMFQRMEGLLVELAAMRRTDAQLTELRGLQNRLIAIGQTGDAVAHAALNREFHHLMHAMARSPLLDEKQRSNFNMCDFFITHSAGFEAFMSDAVQDHEQIIDAIARHQPERAKLVAEAHIAAVAGAVLVGLEKG
ncbi:MAG: GntR family transcriptional regulator [Sphingomonas sp.]|uniref:GntR family transcriptional regulator n=1 Tax=Sphingomonas sp. TaxID=28214 RepID=UPI0025F26B03|nr:GntR family transcriptional regulator [Sphingomonas sp.]MBX3563560.1 GntR family transcriptional regulator [Sphingomonas sp.]